MKIRRAQEKDIGKLIELLEQVLTLHAQLRPDIFIPGTTKYTYAELAELLRDEKRPIYVAADEEDAVLGYAFCILQNQPFSNNMIPFVSMFIDDLCVDASARGQGVGRALFDYVKQEAVRLGCYELTLNVWEGNDAARRFYDRQGMKPKETQMELIL